jgi:hypothetical protein
MGNNSTNISNRNSPHLFKSINTKRSRHMRLEIKVLTPVYRTECKHCVISDTIFYTHLFVTTFRRNLYFENIFSVFDLRTLFVPVLSSNISSIVRYWNSTNISNRNSPHLFKSINTKRSRHMRLEIKVLTWNRYNNVAWLNLLMWSDICLILKVIKIISVSKIKKKLLLNPPTQYNLLYFHVVVVFRFLTFRKMSL